MGTRIQKSTSVYKVAGSLSLTIDVHAPEGYNPDSGTALIHFHGGYLVIGEKTTFPPHWLINACHRRGWAYATPSYRLMPETNGLDILQDAVDATNWIRDHFARSDRLIVAGSSAGGYLALATAAHPQSPPVTALLPIYGMLDPAGPRYVKPGQPLTSPVDNLESVVEHIYSVRAKAAEIDGYAFPQDRATDERYTWIKALHEAALYPDILTDVRGLAQKINERGVDAIPDEFRQLFPASFGLRREFPPTVLLHGDADVAVDVELSRGVAKALEGLGVKVLLEIVKGQGHGFDVMETPADIDILNESTGDLHSSLARVFKFLEQAVG
ncbi:alpha/beta-hydrolase [Daldinia vernicosa]|uniref:alpha/beta-hydrolase n=1 Tax=Daldinia vernicosa TaxID=114800 RepID=UPI002008D543|nr:alpha/beta-hydrolase [Daldinia vernicosa]KAI0850818.1 alpha/beta-hydrolase [Daldinia vernicosa]